MINTRVTCSLLLSVSMATHAGSAYAADQAVAVVPPARAAAIDYALPQTEIELTADLVLRECGTAPKAVPTLTLVAAAAADPVQRFRIDGYTLNSWRLKRDLDIALYDNGTIKTINSTTSDRSASILGSIVKFVASIIVPLSGQRVYTNYSCNSVTEAALVQVSRLEAAVHAESNKIAAGTQSPAENKASVEIIDALAQKLGNLRSGPLRVTLRRKLDLSNPTRNDNDERVIGDKEIAWNTEQDARALSKWFVLHEGDAFVVANRAGMRATGLFAGRSDADLDKLLIVFPWFKLSFDVSVKRSVPLAGASTRIRCPEDPGCDKSVVVRPPVDSSIVVRTLAKDLIDENGGTKLTAKASAPIAQWGTPSFLSLGAKVLTTRTVALSLDPFNRTTAFGWKSEAKGEVLAGALGGAAESVGSYRKAFAGQSQTEANAEMVTELETQKKLNALIACREILEAGGYTCPGDE